MQEALEAFGGRLTVTSSLWEGLGSVRQYGRAQVPVGGDGDFRSRVGPAAGGGGKGEGAMRASDIRAEGRLERPFRRCGPGGAG